MLSLSTKTVLTVFLISSLFTATFGYGQVLNYSTYIEVVDGSLHKTETYQIIVKNKESNWLADISIPVDGNEEFELISANVSDIGGNTKRKIKKKEVITRSRVSRGSLFEDDLYYEFSLNWNVYPYIISYSYRTITEEFIYITRWIPTYYTDLRISKASLTVKLPRNYGIKIDSTSGFIYSERCVGDKIVYDWELHDYIMDDTESLSPSLLESIPKVVIIPTNFHYAVDGSTESWDDFGNWQYKLNLGGNKLPVHEKTIIDKLVSNINDTNEIIRTIYHYLQDNTRYINVAIDEGGLKPYPAEYVSKNKYGDCKALTYYMKSMLEYVGIDSYYSLVVGGIDNQSIDQSFPSQQFNHVILSIPVGTDTIWLENTSNYLPYNYLGTFTQNRFALVVKEKNSKLVRTPSLDLEDIKSTADYRIEINDNGAGLGNIELKLGGREFERIKYFLKEGNEDDQEKEINKLILLSDYNVLNWEYDTGNRDSINLKLEIQLELDNQIRQIGNRKVIKTIPMVIPDLEDPEERKTGLKIPYPVNREVKAEYILLSIMDYSIQVPDNIVIKSEFGYYSEQYTIDENNISVIKKYILFGGIYPLERYNEFYNYIKSINKSQKKSSIIFTKL